MQHNGIIENFGALRESLKRKGHEFYSDTDTEVLVKLIDDCMKKSNLSLEAATRQALTQVNLLSPLSSLCPPLPFLLLLSPCANQTKPLLAPLSRQVVGAYGLVIVSKENPDLLISARMGSPLILGIGEEVRAACVSGRGEEEARKRRREDRKEAGGERG